MKGKRGRPSIPLSKVSNRKSTGLTGASGKPSGFGYEPMLAHGGPAKKRLDKRARGGGIHIKPENKGLLHEDTGTPAGEKIPAKKLTKAKNSPDPAVRKRATFAENAKEWNKK